MTTLFLFPFAGASIYSYRFFEESAGKDVELVPLELPGRGRRITEPFLNSLEEAVEDIVRQIRSLQRDSFAFFGHSMGAILAYRVTLSLMRDLWDLPQYLFLAGHRAPTCRQRTPVKFNLPREKLIEELRDLQGVPQELLEDPEAMEFFEPILRSDFKLIENYCQDRPETVPVPIHLFMGREDDISEPEKQKWKDNTTDEFSITEYNGNHFFLYEHKVQILTTISSCLNSKNS